MCDWVGEMAAVDVRESSLWGISPHRLGRSGTETCQSRRLGFDSGAQFLDQSALIAARLMPFSIPANTT